MILFIILDLKLIFLPVHFDITFLVSIYQTITCIYNILYNATQDNLTSYWETKRKKKNKNKNKHIEKNHHLSEETWLPIQNHFFFIKK